MFSVLHMKIYFTETSTQRIETEKSLKELKIVQNR